MTISDVLLSAIERRKRADRHATVRRYVTYRTAFPAAEIDFPATALKDEEVASWVRDHRVPVDVRAGEDIDVALAAGVPPGQMSVHADVLGDAELCAVVSGGARRVVVSSAGQAELVASCVRSRRQSVAVRLREPDTTDREIAPIAEILKFNLVGVYGDIASKGGVHSEVIRYLVGVMAMIGRRHGVVLCRLGLCGRSVVPPGDWAVELPGFAAAVEDSIDEACEALRFPRPLVALSPGAALLP